MMTKTRENAIICATRNRTVEWMRSYNMPANPNTLLNIKERTIKYLRIELGQRGYPSADGWTVEIRLNPNELMSEISIDIKPPVVEKALPENPTHPSCGKSLAYPPNDCDLCEEAAEKLTEPPPAIDPEEDIRVTMKITDSMIIRVFTDILRKQTGHTDLVVEPRINSRGYRAVFPNMTLADVSE